MKNNPVTTFFQRRPWVGLLLFFVCLMTFAIVFANIMVAHDHKVTERRSEQCVEQGGKVIHLDSRVWCLIDGEKIEF